MQHCTEKLHWDGSTWSCVILVEGDNQGARIMELESSLAAYQTNQSFIVVGFVVFIVLNMCILLWMFRQMKVSQRHLLNTERREADIGHIEAVLAETGPPPEQQQAHRVDPNERQVQVVDEKEVAESNSCWLQLSKAGDAFDRFDQDKSGFIDHGELQDALTAIGLARVEMSVIMEFDENNDGRFNFNEFVSLYNFVLQQQPAEQRQVRPILHNFEL